MDTEAVSAEQEPPDPYYDIDATVLDGEIDADTSEDDMEELFYSTLREAEKGGAMDRFLIWARAVRASKGGKP